MSSTRSTPDSSADVPEEIQPSEAAQDHNNGYQWTALSVTTVGALLASIQGSALLIALPNILAELHATFLTIMWVLLGYLLITTVMTPIIGRLADMWGRKSLYNSGFLLFGLGSLVCGLAQAQFQGIDMIVGRVIQGFGGA
ncbi:MAG: MFS transporter, partial [Ktedonobacteraceae bacterium]